MTDPCLLVPVALEAKVVPQANPASYARWSAEYAKLQTFDDPMSVPFFGDAKPPLPGVHLFWTLPRAVTQGRQPAAHADIAFPLVPNRWLIARLSAGGGGVRDLESFIVLSDALDDKTGEAQFVHPTRSVQVADMQIPASTLLGARMRLADWGGEPAAPAKLFLTAVGASDAAFSAYCANNQNVFTFHDDVSALGATALSYIVCGWYSDPADDLLSGKFYDKQDWKDILDEAGWKVSNVATTLRRCLFHGLVSNVGWGSAPAPAQPTRQCQVAVGNSVTDAVTAWVIGNASGGVDSQQYAEVLDAFQHHLLNALDAPDAAVQIRNAVRKAWYSTEQGGTLWIIVSVEAGQPGVAADVPVTLTLSQRAWLKTLNDRQADADQSARTLSSMCERLYGLWWKRMKAKTDPASAADIDDLKALVDRLDSDLQTTGNALRAGVRSQVDKVASALGALPDPHDDASMTRYSAGIPDAAGRLKLKAVAAPRFWRIGDPVILVSGLKGSDNPAQHLVANPETHMSCRLPAEVITAFQPKGQPDPWPADKFDHVIPVPPLTHLPPQVVDVFKEAFFLDEVNAPMIASQPGVVATVAQVRDSIQTRTGMSGVVPEAFSARSWSQAWSPLFLEWKVSYHPTVVEPSDDAPGPWPFDTAQWRFDGVDSTWTGGLPVDDAIRTYEGRTLLMPQVGFALSATIKDYLANYPTANRSAIEKLLDAANGADFLCQTLSGFTDALAMRRFHPTASPDAALQKDLGAAHHGVPDVGAGAGVDERFGYPPYFFPLRAGIFRIEALRVLDRFGESLDLIADNGAGSPNVIPLRGSGLAPESQIAAPGFMKLSLHSTQAARLKVNFVSATDDSIDTGIQGPATPVCGWVIPNHLDQGVSIYAAEGKLLGEVVGSLGQPIRWFPAPGASPDVPEMPNVHLDRFVKGLLALGADQPAFASFLQAIDETLWTIEPGDGRDDLDLSVLIGRPLALVRMRLGVQLHGSPNSDQSWRATYDVRDGGIGSTPLWVRLGDAELRSDGVLGYFLHEDYSSFNAVHGSASVPGAYLKPVGTANPAFIPLRYGGSDETLTILLDPRGAVHAYTGQFPIKRIQLPSEFVDRPRAQMRISFAVGPISNTTSELRVPRPTEQHGTWSWLSGAAAVSGGATQPVRASDWHPAFDDVERVLQDGWLILSPGEPPKGPARG